MQVLEWMVTYSGFVDAAIPVGASLAHTAQVCAAQLTQRRFFKRVELQVLEHRGHPETENEQDDQHLAVDEPEVLNGDRSGLL